MCEFFYKNAAVRPTTAWEILLHNVYCMCIRHPNRPLAPLSGRRVERVERVVGPERCRGDVYS